ncbi:MAG: gamma-glutamylcyclotransferase [Clostridiales bacterium]|nr:gamma-glutamylcyclotransferase [Clostridiales bacterium]
MKKRLYIAYGSNLNIAQMQYRCPRAKLLGTGVINGYELEFKGFPTSAYATISPKEGASVPVGVWEIGPSDERSLDRYEGYPSHYFKENVSVQMQDGSQVDGMVYIMNPKMKFGMPSTHYYKVVHQGYQDCGLDTHVLNEAVQKSAGKYYEGAILSQERGWQLRVPMNDDEEELDEEEMDEEDLDDDEDMDYSGGMQL